MLGDHETEPRRWDGWDDFDGSCDVYVFGYGSLVSAASIRDTLRYEIEEPRLSSARLAGWKRAWNVGSDRSSHPERTFYLADGAVFDGVTVVLGLERSPSQGCFGRVFPVSRRDLSLLDVRERNYVRLDVTQQVTWAGKPDRCVVHTYVPRGEAVARIAAAEAAQRPVNIRKGYADLVETAFADIGRLRQYKEEFPKLPFAVLSMDAVVDPALAPALSTSGGPSGQRLDTDIPTQDA